MAGLTITLLGPPGITRDGVAVPAPKGKKVWALLAFLLRSDGPVPRERLASLLFGDADDPLGALRWNLAELRRLFGDAKVVHGEPVALELPPDTTIDVDAVLRGCYHREMALDTSSHVFLEGLRFQSSPAFEAWLLTERRHLSNAGANLMREAVISQLAADDAEEAVRLARKLVEVDPLDESYQALLIRSLAAAGDRPAALEQLEACRVLLHTQLGVEPGADVRNAVDALPVSNRDGTSGSEASVRAQIEAGVAAVTVGAVDAGLDVLRGAVALAGHRNDRRLHAEALFALGSSLIHYPRGRDDEGSIVLHQAIVRADEVAVASVAAGARRELGYVEMLRARYDRALSWLDRALLAVGDDRAEEAAIRTVRGACLSDTSLYPDATEELEKAIALAEEAGAGRQIAFATSFLGRVQLLTGAVDPAHATLSRSVEAAHREGWRSLVPWPQSMLADCLLARGDVDGAALAYDEAFALGCQLGDPCWEGMAARGMGLVMERRADIDGAVRWLLEARARCVRIPDAYLWVQVYCEEALCQVATSHGVDGAEMWIDDLQRHASGADMRDYVARAYLHRHRIGDESALSAATVLAGRVASPALQEALAAT